MKITQSQLRRIIKEELGQMTQAKPMMRNLQKVAPKKLKGGGSVRGMLEYPKKGFVQIGPLKLKFWLDEGSDEVMVNWEDTVGDMGSGNDSALDVRALLADALEAQNNEIWSQFEDEFREVEEIFDLYK